MKFKVGDKVKDNGSGYPSVNGGGLIGVVKGYNSCGRYCLVKFSNREEPWLYIDEELELTTLVQAGNTYKDKKGLERHCLFVEGNNAYCVGGEGQPAYVWEANTGKAISLIVDPEYDLHIPVVETRKGSVVFTDGTPDWNSWKEEI